MQNSKLNYTLVGLFVIAMISAAAIAAVALSGRGGSFDRYVVVFDNVADVKFGTQVRYEGFPVGQVEEIRPIVEDGGTRFHLDVSVREGWAIPADSVARIGTSSLLGGKTVEISRGEAKQALRPGARIASAPAADVFAAVSAIAGEFGDLSKNSLRPLVARIGKLVGSADRMIENDFGQFLGSLNGLTGDLRGHVPKIAADLESFTRELDVTMTSLQRVLSDRNIEAIRRVVDNVEHASVEFVRVSRNLQGTLDQIDGVAGDLGKMVRNADARLSPALEDARYVLRSLARNIDSINHNLAATTRNMNEFSRLIRRNPGLLLGGTAREEVDVKATGRPPSLSQRDTR